MITFNSFHTSVQKFQTKIKQSFLNFHFITFSHKGSVKPAELWPFTDVAKPPLGVSGRFASFPSLREGTPDQRLGWAKALTLSALPPKGGLTREATLGGYAEVFPRITGSLALGLSPNWQNLKIRTKLLSIGNSFDHIKKTQRSPTLTLLGMATHQKPFMYSIKKKNSSDNFCDFQPTLLSFQIQKISFLNLFKISRSSLVPVWLRKNHSKNWVASPPMNPSGVWRMLTPQRGGSAGDGGGSEALSAAKALPLTRLGSMDVGKADIQSYLFQKYSKNTNSYESLTDQKVELFESVNQNYLSFFLTIASRFVVGSSIQSIQLSYTLVLKIIEIIESFLLFIYKFLEKPAELMIESIAQLFLIEWISDICTFIPETLDKNLWESFQKFSGSTHFLATLYSNSAVATSSAFDKSKIPSTRAYETHNVLAKSQVSLIFLYIIKLNI